MPKYYLRPSMHDFKNKVVWITGASSGIGREMALQMSGLGANIILSSRKEEELNRLKNELKNPNKALVVPIDLTKPETFQAALETVISSFGRLDLLFNNAGISQRSYVLDTALSVDRKLMELNYFGTIALTKAVLPQMIAQGGGHLAVVTSVVGKFGFGVRSAYSASKHALHGFFESLAIELNSDGIDVTVICPGPIQTDISKNALNGQGLPTGEMDEMQQKGMPVDQCVQAIIKAIRSKKREVIVGGLKEKLGVKLKAWWPSLFFKMASKQNPRGQIKM